VRQQEAAVRRRGVERDVGRAWGRRLLGAAGAPESGLLWLPGGGGSLATRVVPHLPTAAGRGRGACDRDATQLAHVEQLVAGIEREGEVVSPRPAGERLHQLARIK